MDCSDTPPTKSRHIPAEVMEEILSKLPIKSLLRFSSVSSSWNLMISGAHFSKKYPGGRKRMIINNPSYISRIIGEILSNLPVKSLLRFSSVSRSWNLMIKEDPRFKIYHYKKIRSGREREIINNPSFKSFRSFKSCPLSAAVSNTPIEEAAIDHDVVRFDEYARGLSIRAVCADGVCCLENQITMSLFIWNPSNGKFHKLPPFPIPTAQPLPFGHRSRSVYYGLGYDSVGDDYKLLRIFKHDVALYSLRSNSWRKIESFPEMGMLSSWRSSFVNGALHWLCNHQMSGQYVLVSFDMSKEEYGEVALPVHNDLLEVVVLRGKLCLSRSYRLQKRFVLWVMEEYGVAESWTKKFDIGYDVFGSKRSDPWLRPLCTYDDDEDDGEEAICVTSFAGESWVVLKNKLDG